MHDRVSLGVCLGLGMRAMEGIDMTHHTTPSTEWMTCPEVAAETRTGVSTITRWVRQGKIDATRVGRKWLISRATVSKIMQGVAE